jgi:hypothetical protein
MAALGTKMRTQEGDRLAFWCPGCNEAHGIYVGPRGQGPKWDWDGNIEEPTFSPSVLIRSGHYARHYNDKRDTCWCTYWKEHPDEKRVFECSVCHIFVRKGMIEFLSDCTHALAGKTVPLPPFPD